MAAVSIRNLHKSYGEVSILRNICIEAADGEFLVLLGPSGCGKSTLLSAIAGFEDISAGAIHIDNRAVVGLEPKDRDIAMVFQSYALYPTMTVRQNIDFGMKVRKVAKRTREDAIKKVADTLQIEHLLDRRPGQLSGGQRQRVAIGRALVRAPKVFLFDEPLSNLDAKLRVDMRAEIKKLHKRLRATIIYVTHDQVEAMTLATKIVVMKAGVVQQIGTPEEIYDKPKNTYVAGFIGSPPMNLISAKLSVDNSSTWVELHSDTGAPVRLEIGPAMEVWASGHTQNVLVGIRPEAIGLPGERRAKDSQEFEACVDVVEATGADTFVTLLVGGQKLIGRIPSRTTLGEGPQAFSVRTNSIHIFDPASGERITQLADDAEIGGASSRRVNVALQ